VQKLHVCFVEGKDDLDPKAMHKEPRVAMMDKTKLVKEPVEIKTC